MHVFVCAREPPENGERPQTASPKDILRWRIARHVQGYQLLNAQPRRIDIEGRRNSAPLRLRVQDRNDEDNHTTTTKQPPTTPNKQTTTQTTTRTQKQVSKQASKQAPMLKIKNEQNSGHCTISPTSSGPRTFRAAAAPNPVIRRCER
jgi:hypothetical protein